MSQLDFIKHLAEYGLKNDREKFLTVLHEIIEYSKSTKKLNFALELQSLIKEFNKVPLSKLGSHTYPKLIEENETDDLILQTLFSTYSFNNLVCEEEIKIKIQSFLKEHRSFDLLSNYDLPVSNKVLLHGPSGCGKTLASYVISGELKKVMVVVNLGTIVSSKLGETSKNLSKIFRKATVDNCIIFIDEFDTLGKIRDYSQDHGEMKRVVNTILQLFDYLPQTSIVIAASNQAHMIDDALLRRFDLNIKFDLPGEKQIKKLIELTLKNRRFKFDKPSVANSIAKNSVGLSYYSIQKTLISAIKHSLLNKKEDETIHFQNLIDTSIWRSLIEEEKKKLLKNSK